MPVPLWHTVLGRSGSCLTITNTNQRIAALKLEAADVEQRWETPSQHPLKYWNLTKCHPRQLNPKLAVPPLKLLLLYQWSLGQHWSVQDWSWIAQGSGASRPLLCSPLAILLPGKGVLGKERGTESSPCPFVSLCSPVGCVSVGLFPFFGSAQSHDPAATGFGWGWLPSALAKMPPARFGVT